MTTGPSQEQGGDARDRRANVLVVMFNSTSTLAPLFEGLVANRDAISQVVLVDNGSSDGSASAARLELQDCALNGAVIESSNTGFAGGHWTARNAFAETDHPTLCLNPDVRLDAGALKDMLDVLRGSETLAIVTTPLVGRDGVEDSASRRRLPTLTTGALYSMVGRMLPARLRYNSQVNSPIEVVAGHPVSRTEATTGALMLVASDFRKVSTGIFDPDYFMYGEDLQLCLEAKREGKGVGIVERPPSVHVKGVSSGFPRSWRSNRAFHDALFVYYRKNMSRSRFDAAVVRAIVSARLAVSAGTSWIARRSRRRVA